MSKRSSFILFIIILLSSSFCSPANTETALILSVKGEAFIKNPNKKFKKAYPLATLEVGSILKTGNKSFVNLVLYSNNREYVLLPNSKIKVNSRRIETLKGKIELVKKRKVLSLPKNKSLSSRRVLGETVRKEKGFIEGFIYPVDGESVETESITFKWNFADMEEKTEVIFTLTDEKGNKIYTHRTDKTSLTYPPQKAPPLERGKIYTAHIQPANALDENIPEVEVQFRVLSTDEFNRVKKAEATFKREIKKAETDKKLLVAKMIILYLNYGLFHKALDVSIMAKKIMPKNPYVYYYISYIHKRLGNYQKAKKYMEEGKNISK